VPERSNNVVGEVGEVWQLVIAYLKQETIEEIKPLGRFLLWGVAGSILLCIGLILLTLSGLRALQTETGTTFTGNWSWAPYLITLVGCGLFAGLAARAITARSRKENT
jgi:hypothetical protein